VSSRFQSLLLLLEDQLHALRKKGIAAELLSQSTDQETVNRVHKFLNDSGYSTQLKLLYVTPERMAKSKRLMSALQKSYQNKKLERIAIDEVHCCSVLGHDFRPDYKYLSTLKTLFPNTPIIGVTATASRKVLVDVQKILNIRGCLIFNSPFNRPNLFYGVVEKPSENEALYDLLADMLKNRYAGQSGIIYTFSIKDTETLVSELLQRDCKVRPYHAQLEANQRSNVYQKWMDNQIQAVVATIAFGLGIDKPDCRFVIHHTLSKSMENFYQESGRCGRDGNYAECILLYKFSDMFKISTMTFAETNGLRNAYSMVNYCINAKKCRRDLFSNYFTEVWSEKSCGKMCDHCFNQKMVQPPKMDLLVHYRTLLKILDKAASMDIKMTALKLIDAWFHKGPAKMRLETPPPSIDRFFGEQIVAFLLIEDYLREDFHYTAYSTISYIQRGPTSPQDDEIEFFPSRIYDLPPMKELQDFLQSTSDDFDEVSFVSEKKFDPNTSRKRRISDSDSDSDDLMRVNSPMKSSTIEQLIEKKVESKLRKIFGESEGSTSKDSDKDADSDVVVLTPKNEKPEVIEID
jgi:ATP-dependent DNA helicase Q1